MNNNSNTSYSEQDIRRFVLGYMMGDERTAFIAAAIGNAELWQKMDLLWEDLLIGYTRKALNADDARRLKYLDEQLGTDDILFAESMIDHLGSKFTGIAPSKVNAVVQQANATAAADNAAEEQEYLRLKSYLLGQADEAEVMRIESEYPSTDNWNDLYSAHATLIEQYNRKLLTAEDVELFDTYYLLTYPEMYGLHDRPTFTQVSWENFA